MKIEKFNNIIFFDGVCNLCNRFIDFAIKRDKNNEIKYSSLQSEFAVEFLRNYNITIDIEKLGTIYFFTDGKMYNKSTAILKIVSHFGGVYPFFSKILIHINKRFRDFMYNSIAKNRYNFFGKKDTCRMPTKEERNKLLDKINESA